MNYWFTADYHLGHANIIKYVGRPFHSLEHMDRVIIANHNQRVKDGDVVFHVGDFCFRGGKEGAKFSAAEYESQLNGKLIFIRGNHDHNNSCHTIIESMILSYGGYSIYMVHWPEKANDAYPLNFCAHVHANWKHRRLSSGTILVNVGVDVWHYRPVSIDEILKYLHDEDLL